MMELKQRGEHIFGPTAGSVILENPISDTSIQNVFPSDTPQPAELVMAGICINCDNLGACIWQHNNNTNCQHYQ